MARNSIRLETDGKPIKIAYSAVKIHEELGCEMGDLQLTIGDVDLGISFDSCEEMITFCKKHNFEYSDKRPK